MKFIVISDSHGRYERITRVMDMHRDADALIFLGDGISDLERAQAYTRGMTVFAVRGNCDSFSPVLRDAPENELLLNFEGYRLFLLHGHTRGVKYSLSNAVCAAAEREADILLFGHTHEPIEKYMPEDDSCLRSKPLRVFNPGSLGASCDGYAHFGIIDIRQNGVLLSHGKF